MGISDYNAPAQYQGGSTPRKNPWPKVLPVVAIIAVVAAGGWFAWQQFQMNKVLQGIEAMSAGLPPPEVLVGTQYAWRELEAVSGVELASYNPGGHFVGDFDADGDDELLKIAGDGQSIIYDPDGTKTWTGISGMEFVMGGAAWDLERDGVAEIIVNPQLAGVQRDISGSGASFKDVPLDQGMPVFNLDGLVVAYLDMREYMTDPPLIGDVTVDGWDEVILAKAGSSQTSLQWIAYGKDAQPVTTFEQKSTERFATDLGVLVGDVTGDGAADLIYPVNRLKTLRYVTAGRESGELGNVPTLTTFETSCDLNGDGIEELLAGSGFLNPVTGKFTEFVFPAQLTNDHPSMGRKCAAGDVDGDGTVEVATASLFSSDISVFTMDGRCTYCEETGSLVFFTGVLHTANQDYLVVQLMDRLLIYP